MRTTEKTAALTLRLHLRSNVQNLFADWQAKLHASIVKVPGFVSLEIVSASQAAASEWMIVQRFKDGECASAWCESQEYKKLLQTAHGLTLDSEPNSIESRLESGVLQGGVTEVFVTEVSPEMDKAYREWIAKIHQVEAEFPGFRGVYVQAPSSENNRNWITLLQFDTPEHLDHWLSSSERNKILDESKSLIASMESHRVISAYAGWFSSIVKKGKLPPGWKQSMLVLLVLFPIVMLELKFLSPLTTGLGLSLSTFISNAISVTLLAWPCVPLAIWFLGWWLPRDVTLSRTLLGICLIAALYLLEIVIFSVI